MTAADLAALERLLAEATKTACDRATPCTSLCWRSVPACVPSAAVQRVLAERDALRAEVERMRAVVEAATTLHRRDEWHEDDGNVIWWTLPIEEPPYVGTLLDEDIPDYVTHWTRLVVPALAALDAAKECE